MDNFIKVRAEQVLKDAAMHGKDKVKQKVAKDILNTPGLFSEFCSLVYATVTKSKTKKVQK